MDGIELDQGRYVPPEKPTYKNIKQWILDKYGFKVSTLYIAQIKDKVGLEKRKTTILDQEKGKSQSVRLRRKRQSWMLSGTII